MIADVAIAGVVIADVVIVHVTIAGVVCPANRTGSRSRFRRR
ncbi:hypothetical protein OG746_39395 [Streptomyces sp. NBC_01016]|nr:hypothetical protein [Streptomyces sp. NBC_01016]MCX4834769.1 hypothetical protein [Streptomyces sp. NBC_01016]